MISWPDGLGVLGRGEHHEVVAADVPDEVPLAVVARGLDQDARQGLDGLVAARIAVVVVVGLEVVDVDLEQREGRAGAEAALGLLR